MDWNIWLILAGRGYGKTHKGAEQIVYYMNNYDNLHIGLIGYSQDKVKTIMVEGVSGILNKIHDPYKLTRRSLKYKTSKCFFFNGNFSEKLRGFQFDIIWIDELCKIKNIKKLLDQVWLCLRLGLSKLIITTTPKNVNTLHNLLQRKDIKVETGSSTDNKNLSENFFQNIKDIHDESFFTQEIEGKIVSNLYLKHIKIMEKYNRKEGFFVLAIDPAIVNGLTGIVLVEHYEDIKVVVEDWSTHSPYEIWINKLVKNLEGLNYIINIEINQGGNLWKKLLAPLNRRVNTVFSHESKQERQYFLQQLYKQEKIYHHRNFPHLNEELIGNPADRLDALFFAINYKVKRHNFFLID